MELIAQRRLGLALGLFLGVGFSVTSNFVNRWAMPGVPLSAPWPGSFGSVILTTAFFGLLGLLAAWTEEAIAGVLMCGLAGSLLSSAWILLAATSNQGGVLTLLVLIFLPRAFFYLPFGWAIRRLMDRIVARPYEPVAPLRKWISVASVFIAVSALGLFSLHDETTRLSLTRMEDLMREGLQASSRDELPRPLQNVNGFMTNSQGEYTFNVGSNPDALPVQRPVVQYGETEPFIIVKFKNGFRFGCVFSPPYLVPACIDF